RTVTGARLSTESHAAPSLYAVLAPVSRGYSPLEGRLPTCYAPVRHAPAKTGASDLHVLSPPPAFVLSQDQTLHSRRDSVLNHNQRLWPPARSSLKGYLVKPDPIKDPAPP